jgi:hypothetical protein
MDRKTMPELLSAAVESVASLMDSGRPSDEQNSCPMCLEYATRTDEHTADCAYRIARHLSPDDLTRLRRFVRAIGMEW